MTRPSGRADSRRRISRVQSSGQGLTNGTRGRPLSPCSAVDEFCVDLLGPDQEGPVVDQLLHIPGAVVGIVPVFEGVSQKLYVGKAKAPRQPQVSVEHTERAKQIASSGEREVPVGLEPVEGFCLLGAVER